MRKYKYICLVVSAMLLVVSFAGQDESQAKCKRCGSKSLERQGRPNHPGRSIVLCYSQGESEVALNTMGSATEHYGNTMEPMVTLITEKNASVYVNVDEDSKFN